MTNTRCVLALGFLLMSELCFAQRLVNWTQAPGELGLGYPVPIPVDTPDAFDGFRTYDGLHLRHQDLMMNSDNIRGVIVGQTRDGRDIWSYVFSDPDNTNSKNGQEYAVLIQGTLHAREWQSPEVTTGIMEYLAANENDNYWVQYLLENGTYVITPVVNVDGFLQTQRFPDSNFLDSGQNNTWPRDGRMRRKNMLNVDEILTTNSDHLLGVDLNRNNLPFFGNGNRNTPDTTSLLHHGQGAASEPEIQAMQAAATLGPGERLRLYVDIHSFGALIFSYNTNNTRRNSIQATLLSDFGNFNATQPGNRAYPPSPSFSPGIGATDEFFGSVFDIPSFTVELEPSGFAGLDYAGLGSNDHDGFILPESEIRRVRDNMAKSFTMLHYNMAGAPAVDSVRWYDSQTGAIVFNAEWDVTGPLQQTLHVNQIQPLQLDREYRVHVAFNKPMRWREAGGEAQMFPGVASPVGLTLNHSTGSQLASVSVSNSEWLNQPGDSASGYRRYRDDSHVIDLVFGRDANQDLIMGETTMTAVLLNNRDMTGTLTDSNPATIVDWVDGHWSGLESPTNNDSDTGGSDTTVQYQLTSEQQPEPFLIGQGQTAAWFDPDNAGEGFIIEILDDGRALVYWFTYDEIGNQRWFVGIGEVRPNELYFPELLVTSGGIFGDDFDPSNVVRTTAGSAQFIFSDCNTAQMRHDITGLNLRQSVIRLTNVTNLTCEDTASTTTTVTKTLTVPVTGSWFDVTHDGEGFVIEQLADDRVLVYWFTYDDEGNQAWVFGDGTAQDNRVTISDALLFTGGRFGADFNPNDVSSSPWGSMTFDFECDSGSMSYESVLPEFGSGSQDLIRLSSVAGVEC